MRRLKRALIIAAVAVVAFIAMGWLAWPHIVEVIRDRDAAESRLANRLPEDALRALVSGSKVTLYSIDPDRGAVDSPEIATFQRWVVLGQTEVADRGQRQALSNRLQVGLGRWSGREGIACFNPRHAIRAIDGDRAFDFLICFECGWLYYYPPEGKWDQLCIRTKAGPFDDFLRAAKVPMAIPPQH